MSKRLKQIGVASFVVLAAAQLARPDRANPPTDASRTIQGRLGAVSTLGAVLHRSCGDCHSNETAWASLPWYTQVAPVSWVMAYAVKNGRKTINFSEWVAYSPEQQRSLLALSCTDVTDGKMPDGYTHVRPETRLSAQDVETICTAAREAEAHPARVSH